jgi:hypothetical protein
MTTRRTLFAAAPALVASLASANSALAQAAQEPAKQADFLFVQTAKGMTFDKSTAKLTLEGRQPRHGDVLRSARSYRGKHEDGGVRAVLEQGQGQLSLRPAQRRRFYCGR